MAARGAWALAGLVAAAALAGCTASPLEPAAAAPSGSLQVFVVNVAQGDGTVWRLPDGSVVVYDCGPPASSAETNAVVRLLRDTLGLARGARLHALVSSHGHLDHIGGCEEVLAEYRVAHLYEAWYEGPDTPASYERFRDQVQAEGGTVHTLRSTAMLRGEKLFAAGQDLVLPKAAADAGVRARLLWPSAFVGSDWADIAESSIAMRLSLGAADFCAQGDLETAQEQQLAAGFAGQDCDAYLVGHHGSRHASSAAWLAAMDPDVAVVSFGANGYGHPTPEALCRIQAAGAQVYATHRLGTVTLTLDGSGVAVAPDEPEAQDYCGPGAGYWP